ncbi:MAG: hypothetical protein RSF02_00820 [Bacilli bacterium]
MSKKENKPSKRLLKALKQADNILKDSTRKGCNSINELNKALDK